MTRSPKVIAVAIGGTAAGLLLAGLLRFQIPRDPVYYDKPLGYWVDQLGESAKDQREARLAIRTIGPAGVPFVFQTVRRHHSWSRRVYRRIWPQLPGKIQRHAPRPSLGYDLATIGAALGTLRPPPVPQLIKGLEDKDRDVRIVAEWAVASAKTRAHAAVPALAKLVHDSSGWVRCNAVTALGQMGPYRTQAIPALIDALKDSGTGIEDGRVYRLKIRQQAARVLGETGPSARVATPALTGLLSDSDSSARIESGLALWQLNRDTNVLPVLIQGLKESPDGQTCRRIVTVFGEMGGVAKAAIPAIIERVANPPLEAKPLRSLREIAMDAVDKIDPKQWNLLLPPSHDRKRFFDGLDTPPAFEMERDRTPRPRSRPLDDSSH